MLATTTGYTISKHYCGGDLIQTSIVAEAESCCGDKGTTDCCRNENEFYQMDEDFVSPLITEELEISDLDTLFPVLFAYLISTPVELEMEFLNFSESPPPPDLSSQLSFLQTFII